MSKTECPFLSYEGLGTFSCSHPEVAEVLVSFAEGIPLKSIRCPFGANATTDCNLDDETVELPIEDSDYFSEDTSE